ncbi:MAG: cache domain-containing protein, partial [Candidatus Nitrosomaritimum yanchengensis]
MDRLESLTVLQEHRINEFINEQIERLNGLTGNKRVIESYSNYLQTNNPDELSVIENIMSNTLYSDDDFDQIALFSMDGQVIKSLSKGTGNENMPEQFFAEAKSQRIIRILNDGEESHLYFAGPVMNNGEAIGLISITADMSKIFQTTQDYTGLGKTGETFLAKKDQNGDSLFITPLRFDSDASLSKIVPKEQVNVPITQALMSNEIRMNDAVDYRGEEVFAVTRYLENTDWGIVSKIDKSEVYSSFYEANIVQLGF